MNDNRSMAWTFFMAAALQRNALASSKDAARTADAALAEFDKRFGACESCGGKGWVSNCGGEEQGRQLTCTACNGRGCKG